MREIPRGPSAPPSAWSSASCCCGPCGTRGAARGHRRGSPSPALRGQPRSTTPRCAPRMSATCRFSSRAWASPPSGRVKSRGRAPHGRGPHPRRRGGAADPQLPDLDPGCSRGGPAPGPVTLARTRAAGGPGAGGQGHAHHGHHAL
ncbi:hypothetical protein QJS66_17455 [Kocuria rhizophila]|nr:hypothetical protein QJS66_17455 [Kocuria rhizophila]